MPLGRSPHQGGLLANTFARVDVGATSEQDLYRLDAAAARSRHQRGLVSGNGGIRIGTGSQQSPDDRGVAVCRCDRQRRDAVAIGRLRIGASLEQQIDHSKPLELDRPVQGGGPERIGAVRIAPAAQERSDRRLVRLFDRRDERVLAGRTQAHDCGERNDHDYSGVLCTHAPRSRPSLRT
jgi:hypothetical protein